MVKTNDPNKKHYFDRVTKDELKSVGETLVKESAEVTVWIKGENEENVETFNCILFNPDTLTFSLDQKKDGFFSKLLKSTHINKEVFIKIENNKSYIFATTTLIYDKDKKNYTVTLKKDIYKTLQRQNYRLSSDANNVIQIKLAEGIIYDGLDISAGGMSFIVPASRESEYPKDKVFNNSTVRFNREHFLIDETKVAGLWPIGSTESKDVESYKVGLAFSKMSLVVEEELFKHINSVARVQEMTKALSDKK
jgi:c-di-GMP-binding flagellar brake protein YcgR